MRKIDKEYLIEVAFFLYWTFSFIYFNINKDIVFLILYKIIQIFAAILGVINLVKFRENKFFRYLILFDVAYFLTCLLNENMMANAKAFVHLFALQGIFFYIGISNKRKAIELFKKWILLISTVAAVINGIVIFFPIGISGQTMGYIFGRNFGFFNNSITALGIIHALTCIYCIYEKKYFIKSFRFAVFFVNYFAMISYGIRITYLVFSIGTAVIICKSNEIKKHQNLFEKRIFRFLISFVLITGLMVATQKIQTRAYYYFGTINRNVIKEIASSISSHYPFEKGEVFAIINSGTGETLCSEKTQIATQILQSSTRNITDSGSTKIRGTMWKGALIALQKNIFVGIGKENVSEYAQQMGATWMNEKGLSSHNSWLNILVFSGLLGSFIIIMFFISVFKNINWKDNGNTISIAILITMAVNMFFNPGLIYTCSMVSALLWTDLGYLCRPKNEIC